ncbi:MAG: SPFH domain-containing protein [Bacteroidaceae bacterium]|nr:SPFH domain-containing protein [Bacteroidaceae bacterium]
MALFGRGSGGGLMNVIRCDEQDYIIWKWRPDGQVVNTTTRENSIRYGSSLRVKDGEVAVFVYKSKDGPVQDFIEGPFDQTIKTANFPVLSSLVGLAYGGESPFQAEVYFINLAGVNQVKFAVPYFDVFDPRLPDHGVPVAVRGTMTFSVADYHRFIKLHRLVDFNREQFIRQIRDAVGRYVKGVVINIPDEAGIPAVQMERRVMEINERVEKSLKERMEVDFGVRLGAVDIAAIEIDKESPYYAELRQLTAGNTARTLNAQTDVNIKNLQDMQSINAENMAESLRIQREEAQRAQRLQTETNFIGAHALNRQTDVLQTAAQNLGTMGTLDMGGGGGQGSGMNPAGMMTGMMMGGAMGQQMAQMMQGMGQRVQGAMNTPPPMPNVQYYVSNNGQQAGPYTMQQLAEYARSGLVTPQSYVWKQGMTQWTPAGAVQELAPLFGPPAAPPEMPPAP